MTIAVIQENGGRVKSLTYTGQGSCMRLITARQLKKVI